MNVCYVSTDVCVLLFGPAVDQQQKQTCHHTLFVSVGVQTCQVGVWMTGRKQHCRFVSDSKAENTPQAHSCSQVT